jgi:hypothetical protein
MFQMPHTGQVQTHFCENCARCTPFVFIGVQMYPARVAEKLKIAPVIQQWRCEVCHTTMSVSEAEPVA